MRTVAISTQKPPQWILDAVKEKWDVNWTDPVIFTYGEVISSSSGEMSEDLLAHEGHHIVQQTSFKGGPDAWWKKYLEDDQFRYGQELQCYRKQYNWSLNNVKDRNKLFNLLSQYAKVLSGPMYGDLIDYKDAMIDIKN